MPLICLRLQIPFHCGCLPPLALGLSRCAISAYTQAAAEYRVAEVFHTLLRRTGLKWLRIFIEAKLIQTQLSSNRRVEFPLLYCSYADDLLLCSFITVKLKGNHLDGAQLSVDSDEFLIWLQPVQKKKLLSGLWIFEAVAARLNLPAAVWPPAPALFCHTWCVETRRNCTVGTHLVSTQFRLNKEVIKPNWVWKQMCRPLLWGFRWLQFSSIWSQPVIGSDCHLLLPRSHVKIDLDCCFRA